MKIYYSSWKQHAIYRGTTAAKNSVALTFDDGPSEINTLKVLDILKEHHIKATFFWIVEYADALLRANPQLLNTILHRMKNEGHTIGFHAPYPFIATPLTTLFGKFTEEEFTEGVDRLETLIGQKIKYYRPHTRQFGSSIIYAQNLGLKTIMGTLPNLLLPPDIQVKKFSQVEPGSILVFHDGRSYFNERDDTPDILTKVIHNLKKRGLHFRTLDEFITLN
jgi:peptidoglycan-N-acetylglucosamine deacetylase